MGKLILGGREFDVIPASVFVYKTLSLSAKAFDDELAAGRLDAALDALVGAILAALEPTHPALTRDEIEKLIPARPGEAVELFPALVAAVGLAPKEKNQGEAASQ
jgi:hypothetical protein